MKPSTDFSVRIHLLGRFEISHEGKSLHADEWRRRKAASLLKYLAIHKRLVKDQAIDLFWSDSDFESGANNLYRTIHELRQTLNKSLGQEADKHVFDFEDGVLSLHDLVWVDAVEFERLAKTGDKIEPLEKAVALYQGDLLPDDLYDEWTIPLRESLRQKYRDACLALAAFYRESRQYDRIFSLLTPLLARDQADERVHRELMRAYALAGRRHDALRQYQACVEALASELDLTPEPETAALYAQILNGRLAQLPPLQPKVKERGDAPIQPSARLVGRESEFKKLRQWQKVDRGQTILIAGDSGVGKTLLAGELLCASAGAGMITLSGAAHEQEGQLPYQPFIEAFDRFLTEHGRSTNENPITHFKGDSSDAQRDQWALFNAVAKFLTDEANQSPLLLLVDDLHAADEASLRLFHYLARQTRPAPITLLATYRTDLSSSIITPFGSLLNALYRERLSETLNLSPLSEEATAQLVNQILEGNAAPSLIAAIHEIAEGNPFFVQEVTRSLLHAGEVREREGQWTLDAAAELRLPAGLEGLLRERTARLGTQVETILISAAALGREFDFEILRHVTALSENDLLDALDAALAAHLLEETANGYRFRHALIRRALYDSLSRARRARLHSRAGEVIEATFALQAEGLAPHVEDLAYHFNLSDRRDRALEYLIQAGEKAAGLFAFEVAVKHFEQALELMDALALKDPARRWMIFESLGWWHDTLANTPRAVEYFERALALPASKGWQSAPHDRVRLHCGAAKALITTGSTDAAEAHLGQALAEVDEQADAPEVPYLFYTLAQLHWHKGEYQQAFEFAQKSLHIAERTNHPNAIARAFEMLALACHSLGEWQQGLVFEEKRAVLAGPALDVSDAFDVHL
ncbi:MAG: AAA family ATPase [Chloroflexota bacterium]|nr:AAA family ATPase [Chloroflexota bacterium]MBI5703360.1 AAA family ATPase [Chloroflexota bacterium]